MNHYNIIQLTLYNFLKSTKKLHKNKIQQKQVSLTWINTQEVALENKRKIEGARNRHTKEKKSN